MKIEFEELTISEVEPFYKNLMDYLKEFKDDTLNLDLESVDRIDLCGMQVFLALKKYCDNLGVNLKFENIDSPNLLESIKLYKLENLFGIES